MPNDQDKIFAFAGFELDPVMRRITRHGEPVELKAKAFDLLLVMVENSGTTLSKNDLIERLWKDQFVEENNLTVHMSAVRKALGEKKGAHRFIVTIPGHGYSFVSSVEEIGRDLRDEQFLAAHVDGFEEVIVEQKISKITYAEETLSGAGSPDLKLIKKASRFSGPAGKVVLVGAIIVLVAIAGFALYRQFPGPGTMAAEWQDSDTTLIGTRQITSTGNVETAAISPDGNFVAYVTIENGEQSLWLTQVNGNKTLQLRTVEPVRYFGLTFSPGSDEIYYSLSDSNFPDGALYRIPLMGGTQRKVLENIQSPVTFSPDGRIAFVRNDDSRNVSLLMIADAGTGKGEVEIVKRPYENTLEKHGPAWSPDGRSIAVGAYSTDPRLGDELLLVDPATGKSKSYRSDNWNEIRRIAWIKDGSGIFVNVIEAETFEDRHIWMMEFPGGQTRKITRDDFRYAAATVSVSDDNSKLVGVREQTIANIFVGNTAKPAETHPITSNSVGKRDGTFGLAFADSDTIVFNSSFEKSESIWSIDSNGENLRQVTQAGNFDRRLSTSDNRFVVFDSVRERIANIWRIGFNESGLKQITKDGGIRPSLSPDGQWIYYTAYGADQKSAVWRVSTDGGNPELVLRDADMATISPDGSNLACLLIPKDGKRRLALFKLEGFEPVKTFSNEVTGGFANLRWMPDGNSLVYRKTPTSIWVQSIDGSEPKPFLELTDRLIFGFAFAPDGGKFAVSSGKQFRDAVLLTNKR